MRASNLVAGLVLAAALAGCSDDGGSDNETKTPPSSSESATLDGATSEAPAQSTPEADLESAYRAYIEAFMTGDGATAYNLLSKRCRGLTPLSEFAELSEAAAELYGLVEYEIKSVTIGDDGRGRLDAEYPVEGLNRGGGSEWVLEGGKWKSDKCD